MSLWSEAIGSQSGTNPDYLAGFKILETLRGSGFGKIVCSPGEYSECVFCICPYTLLNHPMLCRSDVNISEQTWCFCNYFNRVFFQHAISHFFFLNFFMFSPVFYSSASSKWRTTLNPHITHHLSPSLVWKSSSFSLQSQTEYAITKSIDVRMAV